MFKFISVLLTLVFCETVVAGSVSRYCPTTVLVCDSDESCRSKRVYINSIADVIFNGRGLVESLKVNVISKELDEAYGEFKNPTVKQKLGFVILENKEFYLAVPLQTSLGLYIKEKRAADLLAPGEKEGGSEWNLICKG